MAAGATDFCIGIIYVAGSAKQKAGKAWRSKIIGYSAMYINADVNICNYNWLAGLAVIKCNGRC